VAYALLYLLHREWACGHRHDLDNGVANASWRIPDLSFVHDAENRRLDVSCQGEKERNPDSWEELRGHVPRSDLGSNRMSPDVAMQLELWRRLAHFGMESDRMSPGIRQEPPVDAAC
jgi:hypothetical protein